MMMTTNQIHINFRRIREISAKAVRRTAIFMGLGINAANDPDFKQYELAKITGMQFVLPNTDEEILANFKKEFGVWIVACGLRELIETFSVFLDEVNMACLLIGVSCKQISEKESEACNKKFHRDGLRDKFISLQDHFGIRSIQRDSLISINQARNCLTHRRGIVGVKDCDDGEKELVVRWMGVDIYIETPTGEILLWQPFPVEEVSLPEGGDVKLKFPERIKIFPLHTRITFSPRELQEICISILGTTDQIIKSAENYAKENGVIPIIPDDPALTKDEEP